MERSATSSPSLRGGFSVSNAMGLLSSGLPWSDKNTKYCQVLRQHIIVQKDLEYAASMFRVEPIA